MKFGMKQAKFIRPAKRKNEGKSAKGLNRGLFLEGMKSFEPSFPAMWTYTHEAGMEV